MLGDAGATPGLPGIDVEANRLDAEVDEEGMAKFFELLPNMEAKLSEEPVLSPDEVILARPMSVTHFL